jgi:hypothetical protein
MKFWDKLFVGASATLVIGYISIICALAAGYVMNIIAIIHTVNDPITGMFVLRCVGVFLMPLGGIVGWF